MEEEREIVLGAVQIRSHKVRLGKGMKETSKMVGKSLDIKRGSREMRA